MSSKVIGKKIKNLRELSGMTQKQLGRKIDFGEAHISRIESGERNLGINDLHKIENVFEVSSSCFLEFNSTSHFRAAKTAEGSEIVDEKMWEDFIEYAKRQ